jgi:hypothetical protein
MTAFSPESIRNRIVAHRRVRAADLKPHPLNPRTHDDAQRHALRGLLAEIGLARSVLAHVADADRPLGDAAPLTLIDGHLRREELAAAEVEVEVLDVTDAEARALLLAIDPLARLAGYDGAALDDLRAVVERDSDAVAELWAALDAGSARVQKALDEATRPPRAPPPREAFYVLVECRDEAEQLRLLQRFKAEGLKCSAKMS